MPARKRKNAARTGPSGFNGSTAQFGRPPFRRNGSTAQFGKQIWREIFCQVKV